MNRPCPLITTRLLAGRPDCPGLSQLNYRAQAQVAGTPGFQRQRLLRLIGATRAARAHSIPSRGHLEHLLILGGYTQHESIILEVNCFFPF
jgi:hypothetical protein